MEINREEKNKRLQEVFLNFKKSLPYDLTGIEKTDYLYKLPNNVRASIYFDTEKGMSGMIVSDAGFEKIDDDYCTIRKGVFCCIGGGFLPFTVLHEIAHHLINTKQIDASYIKDDEIACDVFSSMVLGLAVGFDNDIDSELVQCIREYMGTLAMCDEYMVKMGYKYDTV